MIWSDTTRPNRTEKAELRSVRGKRILRRYFRGKVSIQPFPMSRLKLDVNRIVGIHGSVGSMADFERIVGPAASQRGGGGE